MEKDTIEFFNSVNKAECYLHNLKKTDNRSYLKLKEEAMLLEDDDSDLVLFDCVYTEELKVVRYTLLNIDTSNVSSDFDHGCKNLGGLRLRFWRDFLRGDASVAEELELLYLNYFTLFTGRTGGRVNEQMLLNTHYLEKQFLQEKLLSKTLTFNTQNVMTNYNISVVRVGDTQKVLLEKNNAYLEDQIKALGGPENATK
ncbi:hypothetical protein D3C71_1080420 [compost metagenome]